MSCLRHRLARGSGCLVAVAALLAPFGRAAAQDPRVPFGQGTHAFRRILKDLGCQPLSAPADLQAEPEHTLLIVLGETDVLDRIPNGLRNFLDRGGAALIATDRSIPEHRLLNDFGVTVSGYPLGILVSGWTEGYRNLDECPYVEPRPDVTPALFGQSGLPGRASLLEHVATNRPSYLMGRRTLPDGLNLLATLPRACAARTPDGKQWPGFGPWRFAVGGAVGKGRLLVLADHSLFINDMMLQDDTDNIDFTYNCINWLTAGKEKGTRVLFVEEGDVQADFDVPLKDVPLPLPPEEVLVPVADTALASMESENAFNRLLLDMVPFEALWTGLVLLLTLALAVYGVYRLSRARHRIDVWAPLLETALARHAPAQTLLEQRHRALLGGGNLWEPARSLARQWFEEVGRAPGPGPLAEPPVRVSGPWWRRWTLTRDVRRLWRLAYGSRPVAVSPGAFARLLEQLEEVRAAWAAGVLTLGPAAPASGNGNGIRTEGTGT